MPTHDCAKSRLFVRIPTITRTCAAAECSRNDAVSALHPARPGRQHPWFLDIDGDRHIFLKQAGWIARDEGVR